MKAGTDQAPPSRPWRRALILALKIAVSAALLYFLFSLIDVHDALREIARASPLFLVLAVLVRGSLFCLDALLLCSMSPIQGLPYVQHLRLALRGAMLSQVGFGFLTGDTYRAAGYAKGSSSLTGAAAQLLAARFARIAMTAMIALGAAIYLRTGQNASWRDFALHTGLGIAGASLVVLGLFWIVFKVLPRFVSQQWRTRLLRGAEALKTLKLRIWVISFLLITLRGLSFWLVFLALHHPISYFVALLATVSATLATLLPLAFSGLGLREGALAGVSTLFGAPAALSVSAAILLRLAIITAVAIGFSASLFLPEIEKKRR